MEAILSTILLIILLGYVLYQPATALLRRMTDRWLSVFRPDHVTLGTNRANVTAALKQLSCQPEWSESDEKTICRYEYQNGYFSITIAPDTMYIQLMYAYIFTAPLANIELLRSVCNRCLLIDTPIKTTYTIDDDNPKVHVHTMASLLVNRYNAKEVLTECMRDMFRLQRTVMSEYEGNEKKMTAAPGRDVEKANAEWHNELALINELHMANHPAELPTHEQAGAAMATVGQMAARALNIPGFAPQTMVVSTEDGTTDTLTVPEAIANYALGRLLIADGRFVRSWAMADISYCSADRPDTLQHLILHLSAEDATAAVLYYRVTCTLVPLPDHFGQAGLVSSEPRTLSIVIGHDLKPTKQLVDQFSYQWKEARDKAHAPNDPKLTPTQHLLALCADRGLAWTIYYGHRLYLDHRFYEALPFLSAAYERYAPRFDQLSHSEQRSYYELSYLVGSCYYHTGQLTQAYYYLLHTLPFNNIIYAEQFVNCLVGLRDNEALRYINDGMESVTRDGAIEEQDHNQQAFYYFLQRRKADLLLALCRRDEATQLLRQMLDNTPNSDYAIYQLAQLQKDSPQP